VTDVADALWGEIDGGRIGVAVPVEDVDLLADVLAGSPPALLDRELLTMVRPDDLVFDLGASAGSFSLAAAARGGRVIAVEASPRRADHLRLSATVNGLSSIAVVHAAVGRMIGRSRYLTRRADRRVVEGSSSNDLVEVAATTVAELVDRHGSPDLVRIRIPGWEIDALEGAAGALDGSSTIGVGADLVALAGRGEDWRRVVPLLMADRRAVSWLDGIHHRPLDLTRPHPEARIDFLAGNAVRPTGPLSDDGRIVRFEAEATRNPGSVRARLAADLGHGAELLDDARVQVVLERLLLDPAERVVRAVAWWRSHPARRTSLVDRARALQAVLATRLSLD
jgi:FkbM family methyltransferase